MVYELYISPGGSCPARSPVVICKEKMKQQNHKTITANILKDIEENRMHIAFVEGDGYCPRFGYSIGLFKEFNHPEIIIIGLDDKSVGAILNNAKTEIENGTRFIEGIQYSDFLIDLPVQFVKVAVQHYPDYLGYAGWYNDNSIHFPALQLVWPDRNEYFPWESQFNEKFIFKQPLLDRNKNFKFLEKPNLGVFTTSEVLEGEPIKYVSHDKDGNWQFHANQNPNPQNIKLVSLAELVKMDLTLNEIYYLNYGESAKRKAIGSEWIIFGEM